MLTITLTDEQVQNVISCLMYAIQISDTEIRKIRVTEPDNSIIDLYLNQIRETEEIIKIFVSTKPKEEIL